MRGKLVSVLVVALALLLLGCGFNINLGGESPTATMVPATDTPAPAADTPAPTATPEPATATPVPPEDTPTPEPTATPETAAPVAPESQVRSSGGIKRSTSEGPGETGPTFEFVSHTAWVDDYGDISIVGEVINVSDEICDTLVSVEAVLWDADGNQIEGDFGAYLDRPAIAPGQTSSFWVLIFGSDLDVDPQDVSDYELTLWISQDPSPDVELVVNYSEALEEDGFFYIRGEVENQTALSYGVLTVYSTIYDADGNVINATLDMITPDEPLQPGEAMDFEGYFLDHFEDVDSYSVFVTGYPTGEDPSEARQSDGVLPGEGIVEVVSHAGWITADGGVNIVGEAINVSDETLTTLVAVEARLYDEDGNEIEGDFMYYLDRPVIAPGETSSFWIPVQAGKLEGVDIDRLSDYEIIFWVTDKPSPDVELLVLDAEAAIEDGLYIIHGTVANDTELEYVVLTVYSILYDADGNVVNATMDWLELDEPLAPGDESEFEGYFLDHFEDAEYFEVYVTAYTAEALGQ
ncbi:MAG: FxLYD domain-containing protein [Anaerolineae bacterium]|jgi:hypothetical protein